MSTSLASSQAVPEHDDDAAALADLRARLAAVPRSVGWLLVVGGVLGLVAAFDLTVEKVRLLEDPSYVPSCNISPVIGCSSIMSSDQASVLGFPNPLIGLVGFPLVVLVGALVLARVPLPGLMWDGLALGALGGAALVQFLVFSSLYRLGALCPYCMVVWTVTMPIAVTAVLHALRRRSATWPDGVFRGLDAAWRHRWAITGAWYAVVVVLALVRFWDYWSTLV